MKVQNKPDYLIFASEAKTGELQAFPDVARGWGLTVEQTQSKPPLGWMNGAFNRIDANMLYLLQQGVPEWDSAILYPIDALIKYRSQLYIAIVENNNTIPSANSTKWKKFIEDLPDGTLTQRGIVQLSSALDSDSEVTAATSNAVKLAYSLINQALAKKAATVGEFKLFPFRASELPAGWYFRNGDKYPVTSEVGKVLKSFSVNFKSDWQIIESAGFINLPTAFHSDGRGMFERPANGYSRQVGQIENDAIRNITGKAMSYFRGNGWSFEGAMFHAGTWNAATGSGNSDNWGGYIGFDASRTVPTANENRPINIGMIPAIYLGV